MSELSKFHGSFTALVTPFHHDEVDEDAFEKLIDYQIKNGTHGLVPVGTTGESPTLSHDEHMKLVELCIKKAAKRVPVMAGSGSNSTKEAVELSLHAEKAGADGLLIVSPYYNKPNQEGLFQHYQAIDKKVHTPIFVYNIPTRSVVDISLETMVRCAKLHNVVGVKDATGDVSRILLQRAYIGKDFIQFSGDDLLALASRAVGAVGCISVVSNIAPRLCAEMHKFAALGNYQAALAIQDKLVALTKAIFIEPGVVGTKYALSLIMSCSPKPRLPLTEADIVTKKAIEAAMIKAGLAQKSNIAS